MDQKLSAQRIDITTLAIDAIVNAANGTLLGGGGVDGAIHRVAGPGLRGACERFPEITPGVRCPAGAAVMTGGFMLKAKKVIHTVGPIYDNMEPLEADQLLACCYRNCMQLAENARLTSVAFPCISTGAYGFPQERAAQIAISTVKQSLRGSTCIVEVIFTCYSTRDMVAYRQFLGNNSATNQTTWVPGLKLGESEPSAS